MGKINAKAFGLACGVLWGGAMLIAGLIDTASTWGDAWGEVVASVYLGYTPTVLGSIIIGIWGFVSAGIWGLILAKLYNKFSK
ncbi:MAG: bacteriophage holin [Candidatus Omnitrophota bacterium]|nr:bacteriophage holin [Candidatus Omnitrophota bacterium]